eukprot:COSAG02_NODE_571_length_20173_cov_14.694032_8_plen_248_part_00
MAQPPQGLPAWCHHPDCRRTAAMLMSYYSTSIALTLYNKWMISILGFHFPLTIIMAQMLICMGCIWGFAERCWLPVGQHLPPLSAAAGILPLGVLNAVDVGCSVAAFVFVDVAFFEVVKSTCPVWLLLSTFAMGIEQPSVLLVAVVILNCAGVAFSSLGQAVFSWTGFCLASIAGMACGVKMALMQTLLQDAKRGLSPTVSCSCSTRAKSTPPCCRAKLPVAAILSTLSTVTCLAESLGVMIRVRSI